MNASLVRKEVPGSCSTDSLPGSPFSESMSSSKLTSPSCESLTESSNAPSVEVHEKMEEYLYLTNSAWCEHRIIILLQEAAKASLRRLNEKKDTGEISLATYNNQKRELSQALAAVKKEYRRTLNKFRDRNASPSEIADVATKAVQSVASFFPWSSDGFLLSFCDNIRFGDAIGRKCFGADRSPPLKGRAEHRKEEELPPTTASHSAKALESRRPPPIVLTPVGKDPLPSAEPPSTCGAASSVKDIGPASPTTQDRITSEEVRQSPHIYGPVHPSENRYIDKKLLACCDTAFISRSLVPASFVALRRSKLANHNMKQRLKAAEMGSRRGSLCCTHSSCTFSVQLTCNNSITSQGISDVSQFSCSRSSPSTPISVISHESSFKIDDRKG